jgi:hypothetical protein
MHKSSLGPAPEKKYATVRDLFVRRLSHALPCPQRFSGKLLPTCEDT